MSLAEPARNSDTSRFDLDAMPDIESVDTSRPLPRLVLDSPEQPVRLAPPVTVWDRAAAPAPEQLPRDSAPTPIRPEGPRVPMGDPVDDGPAPRRTDGASRTPDADAALARVPSPAPIDSAGPSSERFDAESDELLPEIQDDGAAGRLGRLIRGLRTPSPDVPRLSYRGATMDDAVGDLARSTGPRGGEEPLDDRAAAPLIAVLGARMGDVDIEFGLSEIESILGRALPDGSDQDRRWWMLPGQPWRGNGFAATLQSEESRVTFHRI